MSWYCRQVNLVDCSVSCIDGEILKERFYKKIQGVNSPFNFTVTGGNEAGVAIDLVLIQPFLLYYVNRVVLMLNGGS